MVKAPTPPRASPSCARGSGVAPSPRSSAPPHTLAPALLSGPAGTHATLSPTLTRRLDPRQLCGISDFAQGGLQGGTYTTAGITELCEGLKGSAITSLRCAAP
eukprot:scaffold48896_cov49-Phaeocystis_antarctica.AAC.1